MGRVLYDSDLCHKTVKNCEKLKWRQREFPVSSFCFMLLKLCKYIPKSLCFTFLNGVELIRCQLSKSFGKLIMPRNVYNRFSTFAPIHQSVIVIYAKVLQHDMHGFQTGKMMKMMLVMKMKTLKIAMKQFSPSVVVMERLHEERKLFNMQYL